jgi:hypothetical protein
VYGTPGVGIGIGFPMMHLLRANLLVCRANRLYVLGAEPGARAAGRDNDIAFGVSVVQNQIGLFQRHRELSNDQ